MSEVGSFGKQAIELCKNVYKGMSGKYGQYSVKAGEKMVNANMSESQKQRIIKVANNAIEKGIMKNGKRVYGEEASKVATDFMTNKINTVNSLPYKFGNSVGGGIRDSLKYYKKNKTDNFSQDLNKSLSHGFKKMVKNEKGEMEEQLRVGRVAGAMFGVGVAGRVVTGGGLYRDKNGNTNLPGIPFI